MYSTVPLGMRSGVIGQQQPLVHPTSLAATTTTATTTTAAAPMAAPPDAEWFQLSVVNGSDDKVWWRVLCHPRETIMTVRKRLVRGAGTFVPVLYHDGSPLVETALVEECQLSSFSVLSSGRGASLIYGRKAKVAERNLKGGGDGEGPRWNTSGPNEATWELKPLKKRTAVVSAAPYAVKAARAQSASGQYSRQQPPHRQQRNADDDDDLGIYDDNDDTENLDLAVGGRSSGALSLHPQRKSVTFRSPGRGSGGPQQRLDSLPLNAVSRNGLQCTCSSHSHQLNPPAIGANAIEPLGTVSSYRPLSGGSGTSSLAPSAVVHQQRTQRSLEAVGGSDVMPCNRKNLQQSTSTTRSHSGGREGGGASAGRRGRPQSASPYGRRSNSANTHSRSPQSRPPSPSSSTTARPSLSGSREAVRNLMSHVMPPAAHVQTNVGIQSGTAADNRRQQSNLRARIRDLEQRNQALEQSLQDLQASRAPQRIGIQTPAFPLGPGMFVPQQEGSALGGGRAPYSCTTTTNSIHYGVAPGAVLPYCYGPAQDLLAPPQPAPLPFGFIGLAAATAATSKPFGPTGSHNNNMAMTAALYRPPPLISPGLLATSTQLIGTAVPL